ncbi:hypothetical protein [Streptomyces sp. IB201691-2A2]|uniref:hypothetical protein n=1 Tax=Streptomyces sp. IB201691-2A2 TaxID=2561920 RepID=UPI0037D9BDDE
MNEAEPLVDAALRELSEESGRVGRGRRAVRGDSHPSLCRGRRGRSRRCGRSSPIRASGVGMLSATASKARRIRS